MPNTTEVFGTRSSEIYSSTNITDNSTYLPEEPWLLCGVPAVCKNATFETCVNTTLLSCEECPRSESILFVFFVTCLGLAILLGNSLVIAVSFYRYRRRSITKGDICKCSLAFADIMTGLLIFGIVLPNFHWSMNSTGSEVDLHQARLHNSSLAVAGGLFYLFGLSSSLYHLLYLGLQRLYAIAFPFQYRSQAKSSVLIALGLVWILSIISASVPAWFPYYYSFDYYHITYLYSFSLDPDAFTASKGPAYALLSVFAAIPYGLMSLSLIVTCILIPWQLRRTRHQFPSESRKKKIFMNELHTFSLVALMQAGFTITLIPLCVVTGLSYSDYFTCDDISKPYTAGVYLSMSNSLVNVIVYSLRDKEFRSTLADMFLPWKSKWHRRPTHLYTLSRSRTTVRTVAHGAIANDYERQQR